MPANRTWYLLLKTIVDVRRMHSSLKLQSCPLLHSKIVEQITQTEYNGKDGVCRASQVDHRKASFCRANHVDADNHKRVRFEINADNNNDIQQHNVERKCVCNGPIGVGVCKSSLEGSRVEV